MLPEPLHPAVVHFPLVLMFLLPLFAVGGFWAIRKGARVSRAWALPLLVAAALSASSYVALQTGEQGEERVENVVPETALHAHEEAAERFLLVGLLVLGIAALGMVRGHVGTAARALSIAGSIVVAVAGVQVGAAGGELVYGHNAASVYATGTPGVTAQAQDHDDD